MLKTYSSRRDFSTLTSHDGENILFYTNRASSLAFLLSGMEMSIDCPEMVVAVSNGLPDDFDYIVIKLDAIADDLLSRHLVKSCSLPDK